MNIQPMLNLVARAGRLDHRQPIAARLMSWLREDLDDIATVQLESQRNHAPVYFGSNACVPDLSVDRIGKIDGRRITRQHHDLAFRREGVNLFWIQIYFQRGEK